MSAILANSSASASGGMGMFGMIIWLVVIFGFMYFLMIRPQKKRQKEEQEMRNALEIGDEIVTIGGIVGRVVTIRENDLIIETGAVIVEFGNNKNCRIPMQKAAIADVEKAESAS